MKRGTTGDIVVEGEVRFDGRAHRRAAGARDPQPRPGALPRAAPSVPRADGAREPARRGLPVAGARRKPQQRLEHCFALFPRLKERAGPDRGHALRRRAADARHRARAHVRGQAAVHRRALARPRAENPRRSCSPPSRRSTPTASRCCWSSRKWARCSEWPTATTCCRRGASSPKGSGGVTDGRRDAARRLSGTIATSATRRTSRQLFRVNTLRFLQRGHAVSILSRTQGVRPRGMNSRTSSTITAKISRRISLKLSNCRASSVSGYRRNTAITGP